MNYGLVNRTGELMERMHSVNATNYGDALILMTRQLNQIYLDYGYVSDGVSIIEYQGYDPEEHPEYGYFDKNSILCQRAHTPSIVFRLGRG